MADPQHCRTCSCSRGLWEVHVQWPNGSAGKPCQTRDEAIQWAKREIDSHCPVDWFHEATISITFGGHHA